MVKVAVSIPDELFDRAARVAERDGISRSELYAQALREYLGPLDAAEITRQLDAVHGVADQDERAWIDAAAQELGRALADDEW